MPLWNPYAFAGMPFQADIQSALFYIPNLLLTFFVRDGTLSMYWIELVLITHYWLAGVTMYYFARELGQDRAGALFGGLVFALSGFMIARAVHPAFVEQLAWLPLVMLLVRRALLRGSWRYAIGGGLVTGHAVLAGAPQITLFMFLLMGAYALFLVLSIRGDEPPLARLWRLRFAVLVALITAGVAAVQLLPTLELIPLSQRSEFAADQALYRLSPEKLLTLLMPGFFGVSGATTSTYWASPEFGAFWETCFYLGIAGLGAALFSAKRAVRDRDGHVVFFLCVAAVSLVSAVGDQFVLYRVFHELIPGFSMFRGAARMTVLATFSLALLSGFGFQEILRAMRDNPRATRFLALGMLAAVGLIWAGSQLLLFPALVEDSRYDEIHTVVVGESFRTLLLTAAFAAILVFGRRLAPSLAAAGIILLQYGDVTAFGFALNNGAYGIEDYYREARTIVPQLQEEGKRELFRVTVRKGQVLLMDRNQGMVDRVFLTEGYTPLALRRVVPPARDWDAAYDLLNSRHRINVDERAQQMSIRTVDTYLPRAFVVHEARVMNDDSTIAAFMRGVEFNPSRMVVLEEAVTMPAASDSGAPRGRAAIRGFTLNGVDMVVEMPRPGFLVMSEIYYPGWVAYVNGVREPILRANWSLRAVALGSGSHNVDVRFEPATFRVGAVLSVCTLFGGVVSLGVITFVGWRRRRII